MTVLSRIFTLAAPPCGHDWKHLGQRCNETRQDFDSLRMAGCRSRILMTGLWLYTQVISARVADAHEQRLTLAAQLPLKTNTTLKLR